MISEHRLPDRSRAMGRRRRPASVCRPLAAGMPLRAAASQLRAMPELVEAAQYWRTGETLKMIQPLQRVTQVVAPIPAYPLKVFAAGTLAQAMRCLGNEKGEESAWKEVGVGSSRGSAVKDVPNQLSALVALNGEAGYNLHVGNGHKASGLCTAGKLLLSDLEAHQNSSQAGSAVKSLRFALAMHETLASTTSGFGDDAEAQLDVARERGFTAGKGSQAFPYPRPEAGSAAADAAAILYGDLLCSKDQRDRAVDLWKSMPTKDDGVNVTDELLGSPRTRQLRAFAVRSRIACTLLERGDVREAEEELNSMLEAVEASFSVEHPLFHRTLADLAECSVATADAIPAEGLYQSAADGLMRGVHAHSLAHAQHLPAVAHGYRRLLSKLSWNGQSRAAQGDATMREMHAAADAAGFDRISAMLLPKPEGDAETNAPPPRVVGLEPWYQDSFSTDFLGMLDEETPA